MEIGKYKLRIVTDGTFRLDGGAMFGVVPKTLWSKTNQDIDSENRIKLGLNCLLISGGKEHVLIDTGVGNKLSQKEQEIYNLDHSQTDIVRSIEALGITKEEITKVIFTHLHFDHVGGAITYDSEGSLVTTFPNAQYYTHIGEWKNAFTGNLRARPSYKEENLIPLIDSGKLVFITDSLCEVAENIFVQVTHGHTKYHSIVKVVEEDQTAVFWGDLIPTVNHLHMPYVAAYDEYPLITMEVKQNLITQAISHQWYCIFEHDFFQPAGYLEWNVKKRAQLKTICVTN